jgi:hypothetical protein
MPLPRQKHERQTLSTRYSAATVAVGNLIHRELTIRIDAWRVAPYIAGHEGAITGRRFFSVPSPRPAPRAGAHARSRLAIHSPAAGSAALYF